MTMLSDGMLMGVGGGGSVISYINRYTGGGSSPSTTLSVDIGAAHADRVVALAIALYGNNSSPNLILTGVTIGGVAATIVRFGSEAGVLDSEMGFAYAAVPTGTTATVVLTWSGQVFATPAFGVYRIVTPTAAHADFDSADNTNLAKSITLTGGSVGIWVSGGPSSGGPTYSSAVNASKDGDGSRNDRQQYYGHITDPTQQFTITLSGSATQWALGGICWV